MAGQDIKKRLQPGQSQPVNVGGDFIFLKFADRPVSILINGGDSSGSRVTMEPGDKYRPGGFDSFEVENTDTDLPAQIIMTVGRGDYNRQIVTGEIMSSPVLRKSDGTLVPDTRTDVVIDLHPVKLTTTGYTAGQRLALTDPVENVFNYLGGPVLGPNNLIYRAVELNGREYEFIGYDENAKEQKRLNIRDAVNYQSGPPTQSLVWCPERGFIGNYGEVIYSVNSADVTENNELYTASFQGIVAYDSKRKHIVFLEYLERQRVEIIDPDTLKQISIKQINWSKNARVGSFNYDPVRDCFVMQDGDELYDIDPETWQAGDAYRPGIAGGSIRIGKRIIEREGGSAFDYIAAVDFETAPEFRPVKPGCEMVAALVKSEQSYPTTAEIKVTDSGGEIIISGEIIRAALEYFFGMPLGDEFLDHVYKMEIGQAGGNYAKPINAGTETFKRAKIKDQFEVNLPNRIMITVDNDLPFVSTLNF